MERNYKWEHNKIQLSNCSLALDGSSVSYSLSTRAELDWKFGGEYPALKRETENFIESLIQQNIGPIYVVFDGVVPEDKLETSLKRKRERQDTLIKCLSGESCQININPPLVTDVFSKTLEQYKHNGTVVVYTADGEADGIAATFANKYKCHLVGDDSDFFIFPLDVGYIPFSKLHWTRPGFPVTGSVYKQEVFAASLNISPDLVLAIPAIAGNDIAPNLVISTALKYEIKAEGDSPNYRSKDVENIIAFMMRSKTMSELKHMLKRCNAEVLHRFCENLDKVKGMYKIELPFDEDEFRMSCVHKTKCDLLIPQWIVEQHRHRNFGMIGILTQAKVIFPVKTDDCLSKPSSLELSRCIRQVAYGIMDQHQPVIEVIRKGQNLEEDKVVPVPSAMTIYDQHSHSMKAKIKVIFDTLLCNPSTFSSIDQEWYLPIASICFWAKGTNIPKDDIHLKALMLCFAICYQSQAPAVQPYFDISTLHLYTQWQCTYYDAILLNQVLALPLLYLSPATIFDGKLVTYYTQCSIENFQSILDKCDIETKTLYDTILHIVYANIN